ncbi:MAG: TetR/AcrR family transcriptional regulator [Kiritimatiellae bacterium]|nr:TetR/AcrR family transcriptional regulator [Kiritimatiellia bacterium]
MSGQSGKEETSDDTAVRERLLHEALILFNTKGYAATSVREIVAAAGVSKPTLYYYFASKKGIYLELMHSTMATFQAAVEQLVVPQGTARQRLLRFATGVFDLFVEHIAVVRLIYAIYLGPPQETPDFRHQQFYDLMLRVVSGLVEEGISTGEFRPVPVDDLTWTIISCMNTVMEEQLCNQPPRVDRAALERLLGLVLAGISCRGAACPAL